MKLYIYIVSAALLLFSCKKKESNIKSIPQNTNLPYLITSNDEYIKFKLGNVNYAFSQPQNVFYSTGFVATKATQPVLPNYILSEKTMYVNNVPRFNLHISDTTSEVSVELNDNAFNKFIKIKSYNYATSLSQNSLNNLNVSFWLQDNLGDKWYSVNPTASTYQTNATFNITETILYKNASTNKTGCKFVATFSCKVYNNNGDSLFITNGESILSVNKY